LLQRFFIAGTGSCDKGATAGFGELDRRQKYGFDALPLVVGRCAETAGGHDRGLRIDPRRGRGKAAGGRGPIFLRLTRYPGRETNTCELRVQSWRWPCA
jgi:hypothetical protein